MEIKNLDARMTFNGECELILTLPKNEANTVKNLLEEYQNKTDKIWQAVISIAKKKRSLNANAYFHLLVGKIAEVMGIGEEEAKVNLVLEYGSVMRDENGEKVGFKLPVSVDVNSIYKYAKWFDVREENGKQFNCYIIYEHTHKLSSQQMARLIDGTVYEAQNLNIETKTEAELNRLKSMWEAKND